MQVRPEPKELTPKQRKKQRKTNQQCPWLDESLPRVILLGPTQQCLAHGRHQGGSHASPIPHQRRAHWRTLQADRYGANRGKRVRVRASWVGDQEWIHHGSVYRLIESAG